MTGFRIKRCAHLQRRGCERGRRWDKGLPFRLTVGNCGRSARSVKRHPGNCCGKKKKKKQSSHAWSGCEASLLSSFCFSLLSLSLAFTFFCISSWGLTNGASNICHRTIVETSWWGENNGILWESVRRILDKTASLCPFVLFLQITLGTKVKCVTLRWLL